MTLDLPMELYKWLQGYAKNTNQPVRAIVIFAVEELRDDVEQPAKWDSNS